MDESSAITRILPADARALLDWKLSDYVNIGEPALTTAYFALQSAGKEYVGDAVMTRDVDLLKIMSPESVDALRNFLESIGIPRNARVPSWRPPSQARGLP